MLRILPFLALATLAHAEITVDNFKQGEVVRYPVVVLSGKAAGETVGIGRTSTPVVGGEYRAMVELEPGMNTIVLRSARDRKEFKIEYKPPTSQVKVVAVWIKPSDEGEIFQINPGPKPMFKEKMDVALKTIQCFYAEAMNAGGYGRKTFPLELDEKGKVVVHVITVPKTGAELRAMENNESWWFIYQQLQKQFPEEQTKWCAMLSFTQYEPVSRKTTGHYALGGGSLGAFGTGSMQYWPNRLSDVQKVLMDPRKLDLATEFDDSGYRSTVWGNVATAWGAMAHEMGHAFGLPHSNDRFSVMSRGFDFFNRTFTVDEPPRASDKPDAPNKTYKADEHAHWDKYSAAKLNWSAYFQPDWVVPKGADPSIVFEGDEVVFRAPAGIRVWGTDADDLTAQFEENLLRVAPTEVRASRKSLREKLGSKGVFRITLVDSNGKFVTVDDKP